jgi:hypothetical protein
MCIQRLVRAYKLKACGQSHSVLPSCKQLIGTHIVLGNSHFHPVHNFVIRFSSSHRCLFHFLISLTAQASSTLMKSIRLHVNPHLRPRVHEMSVERECSRLFCV